MIHIADAAFFHRVRADADAHDLVLREGVTHSLGRAAGRMHWLATAAANDLTAEGKIVHGHGASHWQNSDIDPDVFAAKVALVPWWKRALIHLLAPVVGLILRSRRARIWLMDIDQSDEDFDAEDLDWIGGPVLREAILDDRDKALANHCDRVIEANQADRVAVIWGAGHMAALIQHLRDAHGYQVGHRSWMMAIRA